MTDKLYVIGRLVVTIFRKEADSFTIAKIRVVETNSDYEEKELIVKGTLPPLSEEDDYKFTGRFVTHPTYGKQMNVDSFEKVLPSTKKGLVLYLSSDLFPGIGPKTAEQVVEALGDRTIESIIENPDVLDRVSGLSKKRKETIATVLQENLGLERTIVRLTEWGFGAKLAMRIYNTYREETLELLEENPYRLTGDVKGIGFTRADDLGRALGIEPTSPNRLQAALYYVVESSTQATGHTYVLTEEAIVQAKELLERATPVSVAYEALAEAVIGLGLEEKLVIEKNRLYLPLLYRSEVGIAQSLQRHLDRPATNVYPPAEVHQAISRVEKKLGVEYAPKQAEAIVEAFQSNTLILTGGPGTGKTTVIRGIVETYADLTEKSLDVNEYRGEEQTFPIVLAAPTGRAAKRMSESTELPAMTIHRLLGFTGEDDDESFDSKEIEGELIIIDEMSMVDTWLAHQLLKALPNDCHIIFVGDEDQLPSVGPGQVLSDLIESERLPIIELKDVYRQSSSSSIIELAHNLKNKRPLGRLDEKRHDRSFIDARTHQVANVVEQIVANAVSKQFSIHDVQVLAPMYRGDAGIDRLNEVIQSRLNPPSETRREIVYGDTTFRVGDKVLQLVNQPESHVFNGDMGEVVAILYAKENVDKKDVIVVDFDGVEVTYEKADLNQLTLAYCCSIHKAQGSEFPIVIMPVVRSYRNMLRKNLLYTGVTRASKFLIMCGEIEEWERGFSDDTESKRLTTLTERLTDTLYEETTDSSPSFVRKEENDGGEEGTEYVLTEETMYSIDPMIGMDGVTPESFETDREHSD